MDNNQFGTVNLEAMLQEAKASEEKAKQKKWYNILAALAIPGLAELKLKDIEKTTEGRKALEQAIQKMYIDEQMKQESEKRGMVRSGEWGFPAEPGTPSQPAVSGYPTVPGREGLPFISAPSGRAFIPGQPPKPERRLTAEALEPGAFPPEAQFLGPMPKPPDWREKFAYKKLEEDAKLKKQYQDRLVGARSLDDVNKLYDDLLKTIDTKYPLATKYGENYLTEEEKSGYQDLIDTVSATLKRRQELQGLKPKTDVGYTPEQEKTIKDNMKHYGKSRDEIIKALKLKGVLK